jgi:hypothetical protein
LKNDCENANTHAHGDVHLVVLAHLRRWWSLSGREGLGVLCIFVEMKYLFSIAPKDGKGGEVAKGLLVFFSERRTLSSMASDAAAASGAKPFVTLRWRVT